MSQARGKQPEPSPYDKFYDKNVKPKVDTLQEYLEKMSKGAREGYDNFTTELGKTVDGGVKSLRETLTAEPQMTKKPKDTFSIEEKPRIMQNSILEEGGPKLKELTPFKGGKLSATVEKFSPPRPDTTTQGTQTIVRPDELIPASQLVDMPEEEIVNIVEQAGVDEATKSELKRRFFQKRAQMRQLKAKELQDRGLFQFMIDEARKKEQGK